MPKFTKNQKTNPEAAIKNAAEYLQRLIDQVEQSDEIERKPRLASDAWGDYNETMRSLKTIYKAQPRDKKIEEQLTIYRDLGKKAKALVEQNPSLEKWDDLKIINKGSSKNIKSSILTASAKAAAARTAASEKATVASSPAEAPTASPMNTETKTPVLPVVPANAEPEDAATKNKEKMDRINATLNELYKKLNDAYPRTKAIDKDSNEPYHVAHRLMDELKEASNLFYTSYSFALEGTNEQADSTFITTCKEAFNKALPVLEKDIGWGEYFKNLLKSLVNAVLVEPFAEKKTTDTSDAVVKAEQELSQIPLKESVAPKKGPTETPGNVVKDKVNEIFGDLKDKVKKINYLSYEAKAVARLLLKELKKARDVYLFQMYHNTAAHREFLNSCTESITKARPTLEKDLGWGDYLNNLLKSLANAVTNVATLGMHGGFFTQKKSETMAIFENTKKELEDEEVENFKILEDRNYKPK